MNNSRLNQSNRRVTKVLHISDMSFSLGDRVIVQGRHVGTIKWIGNFKDEPYAGIELDKPFGNCNGSFEGESYFKTDYNRGYYSPISAVFEYDFQLLCVLKLQSLYRAKKAKKILRKRRNSLAWTTMDNQTELLTIERSRTLSLSLVKNSNSPIQAIRKLSTRPSEPEETTIFDHINLPEDYDKFKLSFPLTFESVLGMLEFFKNGGTLHYNYVSKILKDMYDLYDTVPNLQEINIPESVHFTVVGDLHGQLEDLFTIFTLNGLPSPTNHYLFNGDFVDRGVYGVEVCCVIYSFKLLYPNCVFHNRGNHESRAQNTYMGFEDEVLEKYDGTADGDPTRAKRLLNMFQVFFDQLPLAAVIQEKIFVCHGGLLAPDKINLSHINIIDRKREPPIDQPGFENRLFEALLWSDPRPSSNNPEPFSGSKRSDRGAGVEYGLEVTNSFCTENRIALCIRSHECVQEGFEVVHNGRTITLFSASFYCGMMTNKGAFITFQQDLEPEVQQFYAENLLDNEFTNKLIEQKQQRLEKATLDSIIQRIIEEKANLFWYFSQSDVKKTGKVTKLEWANGMKSILRMELPFMSYCNKLVEVGSDGLIDYHEFVDRYRIQLGSDDNAWQRSILDQVCSKLMVVCSDVKSAFDRFDTNKDGFIDYNEFWELLKSLDLGLSNQQIYDLLCHLDVDQSYTINFPEFSEKFQSTFESLKENERSYQNVLKTPKMKELLDNLGRLLTNKYSSIEVALSTLDSANNGYIELSTLINSLKELDSSLQNENITQLFQLMTNDDKIEKIFIKDLNRIFRMKDSHAYRWGNSLLQQIASVLFQYRIQLRSAFRLFDLNNDGKISTDEFYIAVSNMNLQLDRPISKEQVVEIMNHLDKDCNGTLDYREFFEAFKIVDSVKQ